MAPGAAAGAVRSGRFQAPVRAAVPAARWAHPAFAGLEPWSDLLQAPDWPPVSALDARLQAPPHAGTGRPIRFRSPAQLAGDERHYERRIHDEGVIATREGNWHDLFNALVWTRWPATKAALNRRQVADLERVGPRRRTRAQDALTQFDEAGAVVCLADPALLAAWDRHDWPELFLARADDWRAGRASVRLFGHALLEHALQPQMLLVAKCLVLWAPTPGADLDAWIAAAIADASCLADPQQLRPLPVSGLPGWHPGPQDAAFYRDQPCFRPCRAGRTYPAPLAMAAC